MRIPSLPTEGEHSTEGAEGRSQSTVVGADLSAGTDLTPRAQKTNTARQTKQRQTETKGIETKRAGRPSVQAERRAQWQMHPRAFQECRKLSFLQYLPFVLGRDLFTNSNSA